MHKFFENNYKRPKVMLELSFNILETINMFMALTSFKLEGELTSFSGNSQGEVEDNRKKW